MEKKTPAFKPVFQVRIQPQEVGEPLCNPFPAHIEASPRFDVFSQYFRLQTIAFLVHKDRANTFRYQLKELIDYHTKQGIWRKEPPHLGIVLRAVGQLHQPNNKLQPMVLSFHG